MFSWGVSGLGGDDHAGGSDDADSDEDEEHSEEDEEQEEEEEVRATITIVMVMLGLLLLLTDIWWHWYHCLCNPYPLWNIVSPEIVFQFWSIVVIAK